MERLMRRLRRAWLSVGEGASNGIHPALTVRPLRSTLRMNGNRPHDATGATSPRNAGLRWSHSSTLTLGLGRFALLSIRGSGDPVNISWYPGWEKFLPLVTSAGLFLSRLPKT